MLLKDKSFAFGNFCRIPSYKGGAGSFESNDEVVADLNSVDVVDVVDVVDADGSVWVICRRRTTVLSTPYHLSVDWLTQSPKPIHHLFASFLFFFAAAVVVVGFKKAYYFF